MSEAAPTVPAVAPPARRAGASPPDLALADWLSLGAVLLGLGAAALFARRRGAAAAAEAPRRLLRIVAAALVLGIWMIARLAIGETVRAGWSAEVPLMAGVGFLVFVMIRLVLFGVADFRLGLMRPRRSRRWLIGAAIAFELLLGLCFFGISWAAGVLAEWRAVEIAEMAAGAAAIALVWWAHLPAPQREVRRVFE